MTSRLKNIVSTVAVGLLLGAGVTLLFHASPPKLGRNVAAFQESSRPVAEPVTVRALELDEAPRWVEAPKPPKPVSAEREDLLCGSRSAFCVSVASGSPAKTLNKLAAALPAGAAKRYQIRLEIVPLEGGE